MNMYSPGAPNPLVMDQTPREYAKLTILIERSTGTDRVVIEKVALDSVNIVDQIGESDENTELVATSRGFQTNEIVEMGLQFRVHKSPSGTTYTYDQNIVPKRYILVAGDPTREPDALYLIDLHPNKEGIPVKPTMYMKGDHRDGKKMTHLLKLLNDDWVGNGTPTD